MKRLRAGDELVFQGPALLVGQKRSVLLGNLFFECFEPRFHGVGGGLGVEIVDCQLEKLAGDEAPFHGTRLGIRQKTFFRLDPKYPHCGLISRQGDVNIQGVSGGPSNQLFRRVPPTQAEGRLENGLGGTLPDGQQYEYGTRRQFAKEPAHGGRFRFFRPLRKAGSLKRGFVLVEALMALSLLTVIGLVLLKLALNILAPRQWILQQSVTDAYMTYERAYAERIPFENLLAANSPWPDFAASGTKTTASSVEIGRLPGGNPIIGTVTRTRFADSGNYPIDGGTGTVATNPAAMKVWKVQSVLTYKVGNKTYAKSRTVLRSQ